MTRENGPTAACPSCGEQEGSLRDFNEVKGHPLKRCPDCGLQALVPQPDDSTLAGIYQKEYYDAWGIQNDESVTRDLKRATFAGLIGALRRGPSGATPRLLDCGAATGYLMEEAAAAGMEPYGVELSEFGAGQIAEKFGADRAFRGPFEEATFAGVDRDFFDVITMIDFIEHVRDPSAILAKAFELLKPGGQILLLTPDPASLSRRLMGSRWLHYKVEHLFYFAPKALSQSLCRAGFAEIEIGRAWKMMNLHYVAHQLTRYPHPLLTPPAALLGRISPGPLRRKMFRISFGEILARAVKPAAETVAR